MVAPEPRRAPRTRGASARVLSHESATVDVWGLPLAPLTMAEAVDRVECLIRQGTPCYVITANLNYAMLSANDQRLQRINRGAAFIVADGMPLVYASRWQRQPLPERVTGADLLPALCGRAAQRGFRVLLLGGATGVAAAAAERLQSRFHGLQLVGMDAPHLRGLTGEGSAELVVRVKRLQPDLLLLACSQPEGEFWLAENCSALGVPACVQIGAAVDFAAGSVVRAPRLVQSVGLEWLFRLSREPRRLAPRYWRNARFLASTLPQSLRTKGK